MKIHKNKQEQNAPSAADLSDKITALEDEIKRLKSAVEELVLLNELALSAGSKTDFEEMLDFIVNKTIKALCAEQGSIILLTSDREKPLRTLIRQDDLSCLKHKYMVGDYITGWVIINQKPLLVEDLSADKRFISSDEEKKEIRTLLCIPIQVKGELIGVFLLINKKGNKPFSQEDFRFLNIIAAQSGQIIKNMLLQLETLTEKHRTELANAAAEKFKQVDILKSKFLANISHEFRTPLTLILGPLEKLMSANKNGAMQNDYLLMFKNANRLLNLINQLLDLSKIEAGQMKIKLIKGNLVEFIKEFVSSFYPLSESKMISLTFKADKNSHECYFDKDKLENILGNLLSNAFKFTPEKGKINVNLVINNNDYVINVEDTGCGIPPEELERIFERFYQISGTDSLRQHGTGIGLSLTKELVEMLKGTIKVNSSLKKGSSFIVSLPFLSQQENQQDKPEIISKFELVEKYNFPEIIKYESEEIYEDKDDDVSGELPIVLIVEDNNEVRNFIKSNLERSYSVIEASNGAAGFNQSLKYVPDLIISDIMMPEMDGYELCTKLKTDERTSHIPVILLTAKASMEDKLEGLETGADDYLQKPFNLKELAVRISNLITQREKLRKRFSGELLLQPKDIAITSADEKFLTRAMDIIEKNLSDPDFSVEIFGEEIGMSRVQLYRKIKALTDQTVSDFIRSMRLKRAAQMLKIKSASVTEICYDVGFNNLSYFAKSFKELFGISPSEYSRQQSS